MEFSVSQLPTVVGDQVLTGFARGVPQQKRIYQSLFPDGAPTSHEFKLRDWGKGALRTMTGTLKSDQSDSPPIFTIDAPTSELLTHDAHWYGFNIDAIDVLKTQEKDAFQMISYEQRKTRILTERWENTKEDAAVDVMNSANVFDAENSETLTDTNKWSDPNPSPIKKAGEIREKMADATLGLIPNVMQIPLPVFNALKYHPELTGMLAGTERKFVPLDVMKGFFEVDEIHIATNYKNTSRPGAADSVQKMWPSDEVTFMYQAPAFDQDTQTFSYCSRWIKWVGLQAFRDIKSSFKTQNVFVEVFKFVIPDRKCGYKLKGVI